MARPNFSQKQKYKFTIVIPARNEEEIIIKTLQHLKRYVKKKHRIIVVNDNSNDKTKQVVSKYKKNNPNLSLVSSRVGEHGFANAIRRGINESSTEYVVIVMADLCDDPRTINKMYEEIIKGWDIVCGSRYSPGGTKSGGPRIQGLLSTIVCKSMHYLVGIPTSDVSNAFKMYKKAVFRNIKFNPNSGVECSMELILQAFFSGAKITDVPTSWRGREVGKSKFKLMKRAPKYYQIYKWAIINSIRQRMGVPLAPFYSK